MIGLFVAAAAIYAGYQFLPGFLYPKQEEPAEPTAVVMAEPEKHVGEIKMTERFQATIDRAKQNLEYACREPDRVACNLTCEHLVKNEPDTMKVLSLPKEMCPIVPGVNHQPGPEPAPEAAGEKAVASDNP